MSQQRRSTATLGLFLCMTVQSCTDSSQQLSAAQSESDQPQCDLRELGELLVVDTALLRRRTIQAQLDPTAEGSTATAYYSDESSTPSVITLTYYGEAGRADERFYLRDSANFIFEREELVYAAPIGVGTPKVAARVREVVHICGGQLSTSEYVQAGQVAQGKLRKLLATTH